MQESKENFQLAENIKNNPITKREVGELIRDNYGEPGWLSKVYNLMKEVPKRGLAED